MLPAFLPSAFLGNADTFRQRGFLGGPDRKRSLYARAFDRLGMGGGSQLDDQEKESVFRRGLLGLGIGMLQPRGQGFGGSLAQGLTTGLLAMDQGAKEVENRDYRREIMQRTRQGMERNAAIEAAQSKVLGADGELDQAAWGDLFRMDPKLALEVRDGFNAQRRKSPGAPVFLPNLEGTQEFPYFWDEESSRFVPAGQMVGDGSVAEGPIADGFLGDAARAPQAGGEADFNQIMTGLLAREGGYVADDAGAGPSNFGINSRANPDIDVANLTPEKAAELYRSRYWDTINADLLPPIIREAAFDAAVNQGPERAKQWLAQAGNDPGKFAELRQQHYDSLVQRDPAKYGQYADGWRRRNQETAGIVQSRQPTTPPSRIGGRPINRGQKTDFERRIDLARELGATPEDLKRMVLGDAAAANSGRDKPAPGYRWTMDGTRQEPIPGGPADKSGDKADDGLNDRQRVAVQGVQRNLLGYTEALTGLSADELKTMTPAEIEKAIQDKGARFVQGGTARYVGALPGGQLAIDTVNSDIVSYSQGAGAAWASYENPTGMITNADREAATLQMPNPRDPVEVQAKKIRNFLEMSGFNTSKPESAARGSKRLKYNPATGRAE